MDSVPVRLDHDSDIPLYRQIADQLRQAIDAGSLAPGSKLPSIRQLSGELQVNSVTIVTAYRLLEQEGYAWPRPGSGTYVRVAPAPEPTRQISVPHEGINFASGTPTPEIFPIEVCRDLLNQVLDRDGGHAFGYQESEGYYPLRQSLQEYLATAGVDVKIENVQVISGAQQGIDLAAKTLINHGDEIMVESPTYQGAIASFMSRGARIIEVPLEKDGPDLAAIAYKLRTHRPKLFYVMPNYQNPTGYSYSQMKKEKLLYLAAKHGFTIVEDDYLSEMSFSGPPRQPLKALDREGAVFFIKSFSKILMPGLRLGVLAVPDQLTATVSAAKQYSDISSSGLLQRTLDLYLRQQAWHKHLQSMKEIYAQRYQVLIGAVETYLPQLRFTAPEGGLHLWLQLPDRFDSNSLYELCLQKNVLISPGSYFGAQQRWFRLSFAAVHEDEIEPGIKLIAQALETLARPASASPLL
ncbi:MAG: PLP-dependent aminotransferase family protein [Firmicutes bacterium]|nr:PLP-dependent aminotransferase family protein [Bacillota bacterium]